MKPFALACVALAIPTIAFTQTNPASQAARQWRQRHEHAIVDEYVTFLKIPNLSRDAANIRLNADALVEMMKRRGIEARQVSVPGSNPVVADFVARALTVPAPEDLATEVTAWRSKFDRVHFTLEQGGST